MVGECNGQQADEMSSHREAARNPVTTTTILRSQSERARGFVDSVF